MSSVLNTIKMFIENDTEKFLFLHGRSLGEKWRMGSALGAIDDNLNRKKVLKLTQRILYYNRCKQGLDEIIKEIAFLDGFFKFSPDEWKNFIRSGVKTVARGLTRGKEMAQVYRAVAGLPKEKWPTIAKAKRLFKRYMSVEDRFIFLSAIAAIRADASVDVCMHCGDLTNENTSIQDKIAMLNAIAALSADVIDDVCRRTRCLTNENTSIQDKIAMLNAIAALPAGAIDNICTRQCQRLTNANTSIQDKIAILNAIVLVPNAQREFIHIVIDSSDLSAAEIISRLQDLVNIIEQGNRTILNTVFRTQLIVDLDQLNRNPTEVLKQLLEKFDESRVFPKIRFQTEAGIDNDGADEGGISRSFVTEAMKALCYSPQGKLPMEEKGSGLLPKIIDPNQAISYRSIGLIFASALERTHSILTGHYFHHTLFQMIHSLSREEMNQLPENLSEIGQIPQEMQNKVLKLYLKSEFSSAFGDNNMDVASRNTAIDNFIDRGLINDWMRDVSAITSKETFIAEYNLSQILLVPFVIAKSMLQRMEEPAQWDSIKGDSAEDLQKKIEGSLTKEQMIGALLINPDNPQNDIRKGFVRDWIHSHTIEELEDFAFCVGGTKTWPQDKRLIIALQGDVRGLPAFHTCSFRMDLPKYETYDVFEAKLNQSIEFIVGGNRIGLR